MRFYENIKNALFADDNVITESVIKYYEENPDELDMIINKEYFNSVFLMLVFIIGISTTLIARIIQFLYADDLGEFAKMVILDVISEFGIAIFGGAVVAYILETLNKKQYQQNIKFRTNIKEKLNERRLKSIQESRQ